MTIAYGIACDTVPVLTCGIAEVNYTVKLDGKLLCMFLYVKRIPKFLWCRLVCQQISMCFVILGHLPKYYPLIFVVSYFA